MILYFVILTALPAQGQFDPVSARLPATTSSRLASGIPGPGYWQQQVDYVIEVELDATLRRCRGSEHITYHNRSPHQLDVLWLQLDQNIHRPESIANRIRTAPDFGDVSMYELMPHLIKAPATKGFESIEVNQKGVALPFTVADTMMRVDLPNPIEPGTRFEFDVSWTFDIPRISHEDARSGYQLAPIAGNDIFLMGQWYPRLAAYADLDGWQRFPYTGETEFALEFGNFQVAITVPADHVVAATGELLNPTEVLAEEQIQRLKKASSSVAAVAIAKAGPLTVPNAETNGKKRTWRFGAQNVRDFAFASSRQFSWEARVLKPDRPIMIMSYYPVAAEPLWRGQAVDIMAYALDFFESALFPYPYSQVSCINGIVYGMEYPMISFCGTPLGDDDPQRLKQELFAVIIHEIGHNFFPMTVNSDERQWTWLDEGLVSFLAFRAEKAFDNEFLSDIGTLEWIAEWMKYADQMPIMTQGDLLRDPAGNAYVKAAWAFAILRDRLIGADEFDHLLREFARHWQFKRVGPGDLFRFFNQRASIQLDWFWNGWFFSTDHVDLAIDSVTLRTPALEPEAAYGEAELGLLRSYANLYEIRVANLGGLVMPFRLNLVYQEGSQSLDLPVEVWRRNQSVAALIMATDRVLESVNIDAELNPADADRGNDRLIGAPKTESFRLVPLAEIYRMDD